MTALEKKRQHDKAMAPVYAYERRLALILKLSPTGCCQLCGKKPRDASKLQIDHVDGRDWTPRQHNRWTRAARYWREYEAGVRMRALCRKCNGGYRPPTYYNKAEVDRQSNVVRMIPDEAKKTRKKTHAAHDRDHDADYAHAIDYVVEGVPF